MEEFVFEKMVCECKEIPGFPGYYVNSYGRVWSDKSHKWLKPNNNGHGYLSVHLCNGRGKQRKYIHRLVAEAFIPNDDPEHKTTTDHLDGDKTNNRVDNLQWLSQTNNNYKSQCLPVIIWHIIAKEYHCFKSRKEAAEYLGCSETALRRMINDSSLLFSGWQVAAAKDKDGTWKFIADNIPQNWISMFYTMMLQLDESLMYGGNS